MNEDSKMSAGGLTREAWEEIHRRMQALHDKGDHEGARELDTAANELDRLADELGYIATPRKDRDENGWRIPNPGTLARRIYDLMVLGWKWKDIHKEVGGSANSVAATMSKIRHPR